MIPLDQIKVASPCRQDWNEMDGDSQDRFCQSCRQNVYNISEMTRAEADALIREKEGHLCVRFYRRTDGTVMTRDCPVGLRAVRLRFATAFSGLVTLLFSGVGCNNTSPYLLMGKPATTMGGAYHPPAKIHHPVAKHKPPTTRLTMGQMIVTDQKPKRYIPLPMHTHSPVSSRPNEHKNTDTQTAHKENDR